MLLRSDHFLFLSLTMLKLKALQASQHWTKTFLKYSTLILSVVILGYLSSRPGVIGYVDVTSQKYNTIDTVTQNVLKELDGSPLTVTLYTNLLGEDVDAGLPIARNKYIWGFWEPYLRFYPNIRFKYEYYYDIKAGDSTLYKSFPNKNIHQIAKQFARLKGVELSDFKKPGEIDSLVDLSKEDDLRLFMELEYKGKKSRLRTFKSLPFPLQPNVSASIRKLTRDNYANVLFSSGHYERSPFRNGDREFGQHATNQNIHQGMINNGMVADTLSLLRNDIPSNTSIFVLADPKSELAISEQQKIVDYLDKGGNAIFYGEPGKQHVLNSILNKFGVSLDPGVLVVHNEYHRPDAFRGYLNKEGVKLSNEPALQDAIQKFGGIRGANFLTVANISYTSTTDFKIEPIYELPGNAKTWVENGLFVPDSAKPTFNGQEGDFKRDSYVFGIKMTRNIKNKEQRIIVLGDGDNMAGKGFITGTRLFLYNWLNYNEYPVYINNKYPNDIRLTIGKQPAKVLYYIYIYVLPSLFLALGSIILVRRKRR